MPGDGPRHGVPVRARPAQHPDRDAARRPARRRSRERLADLLRLPSLPFGLHHGRARHAAGLRRFAHDPVAPRHVRVWTRGPDRAAPRAARPGQPGPGARGAGRPPAAEDGAGDSVRTSPPRARWPGCSATGSALRRPVRRPPRLPVRALGWPWARSAVRRARRSRCRCGSSTLAVDAAFQRLLGGEERVVRLVRERAGHAFDPEAAACLADDAERILALDEQRVGVGGGARLRAAAAAAARGRGARSRARRDGQLRRSDLAVPGGSLDGRGGARRGGGTALPDRRGRRRRASARGARPRPRAGRGPPADLAEAGAAERRTSSSRCGSTPTTPSGCSRARSSWRRSRRSPERTTSASTAPATTAGSAARSLRFPHACSRPPTPTTR